MAIKVGGTVVINDSRQFTNINSIVLPGGTITSADAAGNIIENNSIAGALKFTLDNPSPDNSVTASDQFGWAVDISDRFCVVGAHEEDDGVVGTQSGKVYVFDVNTGNLIHILRDPNAYSTVQGDRFGFSVSIYGEIIAVGAYGESDTAAGINSGKVYIFNAITGGLLQVINNPNAFSTSVSDRFGYDIDLYKNYLIAGASEEDESGQSSSGRAYIFDVNDGSIIATINNPNAFSTAGGDQFGYSVAITDNYCAVGAWNEGSGGGGSSGKVYVFQIPSCTLLYTFGGNDLAGARFGACIDMSNTHLIVGAIYDNTQGTDSGRAFIYSLERGILLHNLANPNIYGTANSDIFGRSVSIYGNYAVVGASGENVSGGGQQDSGAAYIFNITTGSLVRAISNPNAWSTPAGDNFGNSVAIWGNHCIVGAFAEDDNIGAGSGKAYVFSVDNTINLKNIDSISFANGLRFSEFEKLLEPAHTQGERIHTLLNPNLGNRQAAANNMSGDNFGSSVAISGNYCAVGVPLERTSAGTTSNSGVVYIYDVTRGNLLYTLNKPSPTSFDEFGISVAVSGNYCIVGAPGVSTSSGRAYIFDLTSGTIRWTLTNPNAYGTADSDYFGGAVDISGRYCVVGAYQEDDASGTSSGVAYIFDVYTGALIRTLTNPNAYSTSLNDQFGRYVAISGSYCIVSAMSEDESSGANSGRAYIYDVLSGNLVKNLQNPNIFGDVTQDDLFGQAVDISRNYAVISAPNEDIQGTNTSRGVVYVYSLKTYTRIYTLQAPEVNSNEIFGLYISIADDYLIVGGVGYTLPGEGSIGRLYIYELSTGTLVTTISNPNAFSTRIGDSFGRCSAAGNYIIASAPFEEVTTVTDAGVAYIFSLKNLTKLDKLITLVE